MLGYVIEKVRKVITNKMKKILKKGLLGLLMIGLMTQSRVYSFADSAKKITNANVYSNGRSAGMNATTWGMLISYVETGIENKGNGKVEVSADMLCHRPMDRLRIWVYLQKWNSEYEEWENVDLQKFQWLASDYPNEDLTMAIVSYDIPNLERANIYRVESRFSADGIGSDGDDYSEAWLSDSGQIYVD